MPPCSTGVEVEHVDEPGLVIGHELLPVRVRRRRGQGAPPSPPKVRATRVVRGAELNSCETFYDVRRLDLHGGVRPAS